jgi:hypothetical protein
MGSFTQKYVKRHAIVGKGAEISPSCGFSSPTLPSDRKAIYWGGISSGIELGTAVRRAAPPQKNAAKHVP